MRGENQYYLDFDWEGNSIILKFLVTIYYLGLFSCPSPFQISRYIDLLFPTGDYGSL